MAEDDAPIREWISGILEREGYAVLKTRHGEEALLFSREFAGSIHLLLSDYRMQETLNGFDLARRIREVRPGIGVVFMSGCVETEALQSELTSISPQFLLKPFTSTDLLKCVREALPAES